LFNWLFARKNSGIFIFRIEDTDKERSKKEFEEEIIEALTWLGLDWDEGIGKERGNEKYRQSERTAIYKRYLEKLIVEKKAYWCYCSKEDLEAERELAVADGRTPKYSGRCRHLAEAPAGKKPEVIRMVVHPDTVSFSDLVRGEVKFDTGLLDDFVIAKDIASPLYNFAVVVDDAEMKVSHVIRGEEHISNTPRQIIIQQALGFSEPIYAHLPLILNAKRAKLSKREADVAVLDYRKKGYLPEAIVNFLVLMGWHPSHDKEIFTREELVSEFDIARVQKAGAVFNEEKLNWLNREHMKRLSDEELEERLEPFYDERAIAADPEFRRRVIQAVRDRMVTLADFTELSAFFFTLPAYDPDLLVWKKGTIEEAKQVLTELEAFFRDRSEVSAADLENDLEPLTVKYGKGNVLWPLRAALSGREASPDPYTIASILGIEEVVRRIASAGATLS
jgi:nondiscriminating glutamyl-tRNA synthetase